MKTILVVDDEDDHRLVTKLTLGGFGYQVVSARDAQEALSLFDPDIFDLVVTDNSMPGMNGLAMARIIKQRSPSTPVLMFSGAAPSDPTNLDAFLVRPVPMQTLREAVERLLAKPS